MSLRNFWTCTEISIFFPFSFSFISTFSNRLLTQTSRIKNLLFPGRIRFKTPGPDVCHWSTILSRRSTSTRPAAPPSRTESPRGGMPVPYSDFIGAHVSGLTTFGVTPFTPSRTHFTTDRDFQSSRGSSFLDPNLLKKTGRPTIDTDTTPFLVVRSGRSPLRRSGSDPSPLRIFLRPLAPHDPSHLREPTDLVKRLKLVYRGELLRKVLF